MAAAALAHADLLPARITRRPLPVVAAVAAVGVREALVIVVRIREVKTPTVVARVHALQQTQ